MRILFILFISLLIKGSVFAQVDLKNTGILYASSSSDILFINGNFTNSSTAALTNNGSLYVKQDLSNDQSSMAIGTGTLILNGTSAQSVNGSQKFKTYKLQTNNSSGITLNNDLSVSNVHTFSAGIITTSSTPNYLIYEAGSSYSGDGDSRHVNGWVKKIGNTLFTFPVGNATIERTMALTTLSATSEFNVKYDAPTPNRYNALAPLLYIDPHEYWIVNEVSGGTALVTLNWNNAKVALPPWNNTDIHVASWDGTNWASEGGTAIGNPATTGFVTSSNHVSLFNKFTFGGEAFPLPLTLISFNAKRVGNYTAISWTTEDEQNVDHFIAERSDDGNNYYSVAQLPARNTSWSQFYSTVDNKPINHIAYYRLRSIDIDGKQKISRIVPILVNETANNLVLLTNPVYDHITLVAGAQLNGSFNYHINTVTGQIILEGKLVIQNGGQYELPLKENLQKGVYTLLVNNTQQSFSYRLVVN